MTEYSKLITLTRRRDGIGRRDGLKIRWTNHPCGFESHRRHQKWCPVHHLTEAEPLGFGDFEGVRKRLAPPFLHFLQRGMFKLLTVELLSTGGIIHGIWYFACRRNRKPDGE